jgi:hypothetical protein
VPRSVQFQLSKRRGTLAAVAACAGVGLWLLSRRKSGADRQRRAAAL